MFETKIERISEPNEKEENQIMDVWEQSVRATHTFLAEKDIISLRPLVREAIKSVSFLACIKKDQENICAFIGVENGKIEMLFVAPETAGAGLGKQLCLYAINELGAKYVDVNEQNPQAIGFYEHIGFKKSGRSELDGQGNPFPILHMELK